MPSRYTNEYTSCYVIMNISIALTVEKLEITKQAVTNHRETKNLKQGNISLEEFFPRPRS